MDYLGIDFSGNTAQWRASRPTSNVWICRLASQRTGAKPRVTELNPVQRLVGDDPPFRRLADLLKRGEFAAAAIDAPFSIPARHVPDGDWHKLLRMVDEVELHPKAPFPRGPQLIKVAEAVAARESLKPLRLTERFWADRRINVRSTLWWKPRGGAPFAAACLKLIAAAGVPPCWPWATATDGLLVEAFPAAQLFAWGLPWEQYDGKAGAHMRRAIIVGLEQRVDFGPFREAADDSADALDAVVAAFAAVAAHQGIIRPPTEYETTISLEGWIAVHP